MPPHSHCQLHADVLDEHGVLQAVAALRVWVHALLYAGRPGQLLPRVEGQPRTAYARLSRDDAVLGRHGQQLAGYGGGAGRPQHPAQHSAAAWG